MEGERYTLDIRVGPHEFRGEGPESSVKRDYEDWKQLIAASPTLGKPEGTQVVESDELTKQLFAVDEKRGIVSLRAIPRTKHSDRDALLVVLLGFKQMLGQDSVLVTQVKAALHQTGCAVERVDKVAAAYVSAGFLNKAGVNKGGRYSLTNRGVAEAKALTNQLLSGD